MFRVRDYTSNYQQYKNAGIVIDEAQIKRIQAISLEMYKDILEMCERNRLTVMLGGGSALGAIRHKGFIPWDDDIDLLMPRKDYDQFIQLFDATLGCKYQLKAPAVDQSRHNLFIQVLDPRTKRVGMFHNPKWPVEGIAVDIFSLDYVPKNKLCYYLKGFAADLLVFIRTSKIMYQGRTPIAKQVMCQSFALSGYYYFRLAIGFLMGWISSARLCSWFDKTVSGKSRTAYINIPSGRKHYFGECHPAEVFLPPQKTRFEDVDAYIPHDWDTYLKKLYGNNYMELPPVEKRESHLYTKLEF